jgi:hypothetical protein
MSMKSEQSTNDGGPAFPSALEWRETRWREGVETAVAGTYDNGHDGMSLRDYFAAQALNGVLSDSDMRPASEEECDHLARRCYLMADAMLTARAKGPTP